MPPRTPQRRPIQRTKGSDPTVSIASAATARNAMNTQEAENKQAQEVSKENPNDDLKKLIESLKNKLGNSSTTTPQKKAPPVQKAKGTWNRSISGKEKEANWTPRPAYTILTRVSNHEKVPTTKKAPELTINSLPHAFLYKPGADGIQVDKLNVKAGKQVGIG